MARTKTKTNPYQQYEDALRQKQNQLLDSDQRDKAAGNALPDDGIQDLADKAASAYSKELNFPLRRRARCAHDDRRGFQPDEGRHLRRLHELQRDDRREAPAGCPLDPVLYRLRGASGKRTVAVSTDLVRSILKGSGLRSLFF